MDLRAHHRTGGPRMNVPVHPITLRSGETGWLVTGFEAAREALADPRLAPRTATIGHGRSLPADLRLGMNSHMLDVNPPEHTRLRRLVSSAFTRRRIEQFRPRVEDITDTLLDALSGAAETDLIETVALPLPLRVLTELFGVPTEDLDAFHDWTATLRTSALPVAALDSASAQMLAHIRVLLDRKRREPGGDLLSALVTAQDGADRLTEHELTSMVYLLLAAGHETTVHLIGNALLTLLTDHDGRAAVRADPDLLPAIVEDVLRDESPVQVAVRRSTELVDLAGTRIPRGAVVLVSLLAANRDPDRDDNGHLGFGHGVHYCLGAPLARLEGTIAIGAVLARFPRLRLAVPPETLTRQPSTIIHGLDALPVFLR